MARSDAKVLGMRFVREQLTGFLPRELKAIMRRSVPKRAATVRKEMRLRAPRMDGTLRRAIVSKRRRGTRTFIEAGVFIMKGNDAKHDAFYWHMVAFGTQHSKAQDFITPVVAQHESTYLKDIEGEINRQVIKQMEMRAKRQRLKK